MRIIGAIKTRMKRLIIGKTFKKKKNRIIGRKKKNNLSRPSGISHLAFFKYNIPVQVGFHAVVVFHTWFPKRSFAYCGCVMHLN
jgi:hypothetical protein